MSNKRFVEDESYLVNYVENHCIFDRVQGKHLYLSEVIALLNQLNDENEQLKEENKRLKRNVKTFKEDRDSNFKSAQYFREQLMKIPESIREVWIE